MQKFKYMLMEIPMIEGKYNGTLRRNERYYKEPHTYQSELNALGRDGWELCGDIRSCWIFKRAIK